MRFLRASACSRGGARQAAVAASARDRAERRPDSLATAIPRARREPSRATRTCCPYRTGPAPAARGERPGRRTRVHATRAMAEEDALRSSELEGFRRAEFIRPATCQSWRSVRMNSHLRQPLAGALARHLDQSQLREAVDRQPRAVAVERLVELRQHRRTMVGVLHVDEVDDDDPTQVAQAKLPRDDLRRLEVGLENGVVEAAPADEAAGVDVDRRHRLGLVDDEIAARLEIHPARERFLDLVLYAVQIKQRPFAAV